MPVEIKELVIRMSAPETTNKPEPSETPASASATEEHVDQNAIVEACVKQVLHILDRKKKR